MIIIFTILFINIFSSKNPLIIDHDGGVDDVIATLLQLIDDKDNVKAITIVPADSFAQPDVFVMRKLLEQFTRENQPPIPIGISANEGINVFPDDFREDAFRAAKIPFWFNENELQNPAILQQTPSALSVLTKTLEESDRPIDILITGPCTNIAELLDKSPNLKNKIGQVFIMGGAINVAGNVNQEGHDGSAEWNIYNNPVAFETVLKSGLNITLIPLDATVFAPISDRILKNIERNKNRTVYYQIVHELLNSIDFRITDKTYYFWDTLTSTVVLNPSIIKVQPMYLKVDVSGPSQGKTSKVDQKAGSLVNVAVSAETRLFERTFMKTLVLSKKKKFSPLLKRNRNNRKKKKMEHDL